MVLEARQLSKAFGGVQALCAVSLELRAGEVHALVGENGAGKSTLIKIITGALAPDAGMLLLDGEPLEGNNPLEARRAGIAAIYQQPALFGEFTVAENLAIAREAGSPWRVIDWAGRWRRAQALLSRVGAEISAGALARELTMPEQQLVEIARAIGEEARVVLMDEPTASLSEREVERLFKVISELKRAGKSVLYISHRLEEVFRIADRVTVLRDGAHVATRPIGEINRDELVRLMVGREVSAVYPEHRGRPGEVLLEMRGLGCRAAGVRDVSLTVRGGEILGLAGLVGAGRTELARVLLGITPADRGQISWRAKPVTIDSPQRAIELGIAYLPEDRRRHGVILEMSVAANMTLAVLRQLAGRGRLDFEQERRVAAALASRLGVKTRSLDAPVLELSGGNQQKVALARWLAAEPAVLILDEPTQGVDIGSKAEIHQLIGELAERGMGILLISSEMPELIGMSDRIAVMRGGTVVGELAKREASAERVLSMALGHVAA